jgi:methyl-accepting chemotaxis protein
LAVPFGEYPDRYGFYHSLIFQLLFFPRTLVGEVWDRGRAYHIFSDLELALEGSAQNTKVTRQTTASLLIVVVIAMLLAGFLGLMIARLINRPIRKMMEAANKLAEGDIDLAIQADSRDELGLLMETFGRMVSNIREQAGAAEQIANGNLAIGLKAHSERDVLSNSLIHVAETLHSLVEETEKLTTASVAGRLSTRGEAQKFQGGYRAIVKGLAPDR